MQVGPAGHPGEVTMDGLGPGVMGGNRLGELKVSMEVTAGAGGIDEEPGRDVERAVGSGAVELDTGGGEVWGVEGGILMGDGTESDGFVEEVGIEVRSEPMGVGDGVVWTGGDEEFVGVTGCGTPGLGGGMMIEGEAAFESAGDVGMGCLPGAPTGEGAQVGEVEVVGELFEEQVGDGGGGFADGPARVVIPFDEEDGTAELAEDLGEDGTGEPAADDGDVEIVAAGWGGRGQSRATRSSRWKIISLGR